MSRRPECIERRFWLVWMPLIVAGSIVQLASYDLTLTANGLTVLGLLIAGGALVAAAHDGRTTP